jgi:hypothetical protein
MMLVRRSFLYTAGSGMTWVWVRCWNGYSGGGGLDRAPDSRFLCVIWGAGGVAAGPAGRAVWCSVLQRYHWSTNLFSRRR